MAKIKQLFCRHRYADKNIDIVEINHYTDTVRLRNYCVKCGKLCEVKCSYSCMFGEVDARIKARTPKERGADNPKITCLNCKHLMFSDMYGECNKQLRIVNPSDTCEYAEPKERGGEK